jgi:hypothetical protein
VEPVRILGFVSPWRLKPQLNPFWVASKRLGQVLKPPSNQLVAGISLPEGYGIIKGIGERFAPNQARLLIGVWAYNLLHMLRQFCLMGEEVKRSMERLIRRLIKVEARVAYQGRRWYVHVASAFPLAEHYRALFG